MVNYLLMYGLIDLLHLVLLLYVVLLPLFQSTNVLVFLGVHDLHEIYDGLEGSNEGRKDMVFIEET